MESVRVLSRRLLNIAAVMIFVTTSVASANSHSDKPLNITVTIPPLAGMIAPLLQPDDNIVILLQEGASPHGFALKPSHLKLLSESDVNLAIGTPVDAWAQKSLQRYVDKTLLLNALPDIERLPIRQGGLWEKKLPAGKESHDHGHDHHQHSEMRFDGHLWMSIPNAKILIEAFVERLKTLRPEQSVMIEQATQDWLAKIAQAQNRVQQLLANEKAKPFMVLHDGFQYFEHHFGLNGIGSIRLNPEVQPSVKRLLSLRRTLQEQNVQCIFKEPQFPDKQIVTLAENTSVKIGELDPMGYVYAKQNQADFVNYDQFILSLGQSYASCLQGQK